MGWDEKLSYPKHHLSICLANAFWRSYRVQVWVDFVHWILLFAYVWLFHSWVLSYVCCYNRCKHAADVTIQWGILGRALASRWKCLCIASDWLCWTISNNSLVALDNTQHVGGHLNVCVGWGRDIERFRRFLFCLTVPAFEDVHFVIFLFFVCCSRLFIGLKSEK